MASTSSEEIEETIVKEFATRKRQHPEKCSGIAVNLYQLRYDKRRKWSHGDIFNSTRKETLIFGGASGKTRIEATNLDNRRESRFVVEEMSERANLEERIERALHLRHMGILKLRMVSYNPQISKMVSGYGICDCSLADWLDNQPISRHGNESYLSSVQKQMIRTVYLAIEYIWTNNLSSDVLHDPSSYVMVDKRIMILDSCLRSRNEGETLMMLREGFATMLVQHILPKWKDEEIHDFAALLRNPNASKKDIMGHPILLTPVQRELLYHEFDDGTLLTSSQLNLVNRIQVPPNWQSRIKNADDVVKKIFNYQLVQNFFQNQVLKKVVFSFTGTAAGALHLGNVMSAHYAQHARELYKDSWTSYVNTDTVDLLLKVHLRRVLTRRYGLKFDNQFRARR